jgi:hypothetical protein
LRRQIGAGPRRLYATTPTGKNKYVLAGLALHHPLASWQRAAVAPDRCLTATTHFCTLEYSTAEPSMVGKKSGVIALKRKRVSQWLNEVDGGQCALIDRPLKLSGRGPAIANSTCE